MPTVTAPKVPLQAHTSVAGPPYRPIPLVDRLLQASLVSIIERAAKGDKWPAAGCSV
jgi:hypothetical protein